MTPSTKMPVKEYRVITSSNRTYLPLPLSPRTFLAKFFFPFPAISYPLPLAIVNLRNSSFRTGGEGVGSVVGRQTSIGGQVFSYIGRDKEGKRFLSKRLCEPKKMKTSNNYIYPTLKGAEGGWGRGFSSWPCMKSQGTGKR